MKIQEYSVFEAALLTTPGNIIVSGPPGCGKTYLVRQVFPTSKHIRGVVSMASFVRQLALIANNVPHPTIVLDDADTLINRNADFFKALLDTDDPVAIWDKVLVAPINQLMKSKSIVDNRTGAAMLHFSSGCGLEVPVDNMRFIIITNGLVRDSAILSRCEVLELQPDDYWALDARGVYADTCDLRKVRRG